MTGRREGSLATVRHYSFVDTAVAVTPVKLGLKGRAEMSTPEERIEQLAPSWSWGVRRCLATDPIGMEYLIDQGDPEMQIEMHALRLETHAAVHRAISEGAAKAAAMVRKKAK
jgi:hypothetical protein